MYAGSGVENVSGMVWTSGNASILVTKSYTYINFISGILCILTSEK